MRVHHQYLIYELLLWKHKVRYVQMQQSEKPDLGAGFFSIGLEATGGLAVASDLSWRNALVLMDEVSIRAPHCQGEKRES